MKNLFKRNLGRYQGPTTVTSGVFDKTCIGPPLNFERESSLVMCPQYYQNKIVRYQQEGPSCLTTSLRMLIHTTRGTDAFVSNVGAPAHVTGIIKNYDMIDYNLLAKNNALVWKSMSMDFSDCIRNKSRILPNPQLSYANFRMSMNAFADILKNGPFILCDDYKLFRHVDLETKFQHAVLVIGIDTRTGVLIFIDPNSPLFNHYTTAFSIGPNTAILHPPPDVIAKIVYKSIRDKSFIENNPSWTKHRYQKRIISPSYLDSLPKGPSKYKNPAAAWISYRSERLLYKEELEAFVKQEKERIARIQERLKRESEQKAMLKDPKRTNN